MTGDGQNRFHTLRFLFPEGKDKALTFSYDDAQIYDRRLVSILNRYDMKATFHLNSGKLDRDGYVTGAEVGQLYGKHEIASHSVTHPFLTQLSEAQLTAELYEDRRALERYSGRIVRGFSYPFGAYSDSVTETARRLGIVYGRTVESTMDFGLPADFLRWHPSAHHGQVTDALLKDFLHPSSFRTMALLYIWGHSYEFERDGNWTHIEGICERLHGRTDVWYATNIEIYAYVTAMRALVMSVSGELFYNPSAVPVWFAADGEVHAVLPGEQLRLSH